MVVNLVEEKMQKVATDNAPRSWSSYTNITAKDDRRTIKMNSVDNIREYKHLNSIYCSPPLLRKTAATTYDFPEQPPKKDKKWSLGSLFRRKKKEESESSSEDEADRKGFLNRRRKKIDKRKKVKQRSTFDHVIIPSTTVSTFNGHNVYDDNGILSDPTGGFGSYSGRLVTRTPNQNRRNTQQVQSPREIVNNVNASRSSLGSADSLYKNSRKIQVKIRAEARRETNICASSSEEDSQKSASSLHLRSDESINKPIDIVANRKSKAARTERYMRRVSKDEEPVPCLRMSKSDAENNIKRYILPDDKKELKRNASKSPMLQNNQKLRIVSQNSGLSTIPPSHTNLKRNNLENIQTKLNKPPIITHNSNRYTSLNGFELKESYPSCQRSVSYDADIHRSVSPEISATVIHAQLPLGKPSHRVRNLSLVEQSRNICFKQPPPPPPRDPWRVVTVQHTDHGRPMSYCFERTQRTYPPNDRNNAKPHSFNWRQNIRSTSEDHLPLESSPIPFHPRPSSATADHPNQVTFRKSQEQAATDQYQYLADKNPRSRKPILIQSFKEDKCEPSKSSDFRRKKDVQEKTDGKQQTDAQKALDFWKQKEEEGKLLEKKPLPSSPQIFTASTHVRTNIFLPSVLKSDMETADEYKRSSPFKPISPQVLSVDESHCNNDRIKTDETKKEDAKNSVTDAKCTSPTATERKSSNLEDALDELEAIYNSLRLGDEDLLERAEERERSIAAKKIMEMNSEVYPGSGVGTPRGAISDSSFSYEPFDSVESPKRKRLLKKYRNSDRKSDDMALRKLNKERSATISDPKDVISKVSYLLASPLHSLPDDTNTAPNKNHKEPDVTYDDVVFRTIKHANNTLKVSDPQPPFGIPVGPILPACNSDYLHAAPDETPKYTIRNKKIPDIVKDDLAFRNLRKDNGKDPVLPHFTNDDLTNNNNNPLIAPLKLNYSSIKKKRAVRSLSANIYNLIQNEPFVLPFSEEKPLEKPKDKTNLDDIADAMEIARQILREKEEKINATRRAFLSDTEAKYKRIDAGNSYLAECRKNFLNNMKHKENEKDHHNDMIQMDSYVTSKPPRGMTPDKKASKESSISPSDASKTISFDNKKDESSLSNVSQANCDGNLGDIEIVAPTDNISSSSDNKQNGEEVSLPIGELGSTGQQRSSLEDLLTAFAVEAQEASRRIADELKQLEKNIHLNRNHLEESPKEPTVIEEIKHFDESINGETCDNKISDIEKVATSAIESEVMEETQGLTPQVVSLANIVQTRSDFININEKPVITEVHSDSDHDYVNMGSDAEIEKAIPLIDESANDSPGCKSPYEERKADLIAGFQELKKVASDSEIHLKITSAANASSGNDNNGGDRGGEECVLNCEIALTPAENNNECAFLTRTFINVSENGSIISYVSGCNIDFKSSDEASLSIDNAEARYESKLLIDNTNSTVDCNMHNQLCGRLSLNESPHSSGFHSNSVSDAEPNDDEICNNYLKLPAPLGDDPLSSLKSPKLVLKSTLNLENSQSKDALKDSSIFSESNSSIASLSSPESKPLAKENNSRFHKACSASTEAGNNQNTSIDRRHTLSDIPDSNLSWNIDPLVLAFACSYGVACTYQFVSMDIVTILGLLFVFVSFIAALIL